MKSVLIPSLQNLSLEAGADFRPLARKRPLLERDTYSQLLNAENIQPKNNNSSQFHCNIYGIFGLNLQAGKALAVYLGSSHPL